MKRSRIATIARKSLELYLALRYRPKSPKLIWPREPHADPQRKGCEYGFGRLIDLARAGPVAVAKHGRPVVVVLAIEEYDRLKELDASAAEKPKQESSGQ